MIEGVIYIIILYHVTLIDDNTDLFNNNYEILGESDQALALQMLLQTHVSCSFI